MSRIKRSKRGHTSGASATFFDLDAMPENLNGGQDLLRLYLGLMEEIKFRLAFVGDIIHGKNSCCRYDRKGHLLCRIENGVRTDRAWLTCSARRYQGAQQETSGEMASRFANSANG